MGLTLIDAHLRELGASRTAAANEANSDVIAGCVWVYPRHPTKPLSPLLEQAVFPALLP
ncbi:hypothetical protein FRC0031_02155 [Corynebacterium diphtheriae]|nr:hypothetical protein FRC0037_02153 [Corynebacterium diphtheriae]CAB0713967.1 hypothetical protein FRC0031_02155 [Corynebacterium diphtheriae]CAB0714576.1 hypothetical protein FRC0038_02164 [Corynebacterium diphtheriae]CAB0779262.1 hypothetical protein FRC0167_02263 [Corynebacterium diphtheriae]CAB0795844.1 hypothetical protein FRC0268_00021 [Corynebacterium diphtheriae]